MKRAWIFVSAALVVVMVAGARAEQPLTGTVNRIDPGAGVIVFDDGRMLLTTADSVIVSGNQHVAFGTLVPGEPITVYQAQPVALRDGRYVLLGERTPSIGVVPPAPPAVTAVPPSPPRTAIVPPPVPSAVVATAPVASTAAPAATASVSGSPVYEVGGIVRRTDATSHVIALADGRKVHLTPDTEVLVNGRPVQIDTLMPGTPVVVRSIHPFAGSRREDVYATMQPIASGTIARIDAGKDIVLTDGRVFSISPDTVVMLGNERTTAASLQPGTYVVLYDNGAGAVGEGAAASPPLVSPEAGLREWVSSPQAP